MNKRLQTGLLSSVLQLGKIKISVPVALTGFLGYYRASGDFDMVMLFTLFGILFMSMGASTFNHIQERHTDQRMKRTANRPLPAGRISLKAAVTAGMLLAAGGLALLGLTGSWTATAIGLFTLGWYNLLYTPLKRVTPFAVLPGALIGALPPMIGWTAAGGSLLNGEILLISFFLFIGQMPHYWLLMMKVGDEFRDAGLPVITEKFSPMQLRNISFTWILATAVSAAFFPASGIMHHAPFGFLLLGGVTVFLLRMGLLSFKDRIMLQWKTAFITVNLFYLFIILVLIADKIAESYLYI